MFTDEVNVGGTYYVKIPYTAELNLSSGSSSELTAKVRPRDGTDEDPTTVGDASPWQGPENSTKSGALKGSVPLTEGVEYEAVATLGTEFTGGANCITDDGVIWSELDPTDSCEQEVEVSLGEIELVGCDETA